MMINEKLAVERKSFAKRSYMHNIPNLLQFQKDSFHKFLQHRTPATVRQQVGLQRVFCRAFPVNSNNGFINVDFIRYSASEPILSVAECRKRSLTYSSSLSILVKVSFRSCNGTQWENKGWNEYSLSIGDIPLMTQNSAFLINGVDRVVVSQLHRSPGLYVERKKQGLFQDQDPNVAVKIVPLYGAWIHLELNRSNILYLSFDKGKKLPATILLKSFGVLQSRIIPSFVERSVKLERLGIVVGLPLIELKGEPIPFNIYENNKVFIKSHTLICNNQIKRLSSRRIKEVLINDSMFTSLEYLLILKPKGSFIPSRRISGLLLNKIRKFGIVKLKIHCPFRSKAYIKYLKETLKADNSIDVYDAQTQLYRAIKPGEPAFPDLVKDVFIKTLTDERTYNISNIGRLAFNLRVFPFQTKERSGLLSVKDFIQAFKYLMHIKNKNIGGDDVDHLGNRRVRCVGEILENLFRNSFLAVEQAIKNILDSCKNNSDLSFASISYRPIYKAFNEFFVSSHLSQFLDQINPLSEVTHKRRLTSIGISGITKEHAGFEIRDVHPTCYGKICPVETPEGQNIGLINSLAIHANVNEDGFLQAPYRKATSERINKSVQLLTASEEDSFTIASTLVQSFHSKVLARKSQGIILSNLDDVQYIDASPLQTVSVATSLIPFLEHDDANRALMGSNMQRQAVPCIFPRSPLVGTGTEKAVSIDANACVVAKEAGVISFADSTRVIIRSLPTIIPERSHIEIHTLVKAERTNQNTYISFRPTGCFGDRIYKGEVIADGSSTDKGELALGNNALVAFMVWKGYNFEDSVIVSERLVGKDIFTSVHLEEFVLTVKTTRFGKERTTNEIPGVSGSLLNKLDNEGIIRTGSQIEPGDVLVGKTSPKEAAALTAEEKLMNVIFSEKAAEVRDISLRVPPSVQGTVINIQAFKAKTANLNSKQHSMFNDSLRDKIHVVEQDSFSYVARLLINCSCFIKIDILQTIDPYKWLTMETNNDLCHSSFKEKRSIMEYARSEIYVVLRRKAEKATGVYDLSPGVLKIVKVLVAAKRTLQPGDKMAGRHGNKGVVSKIVPVSDMPYIKDGRTVDIILNPLGVPSRMNVGQVLETHLGLASKSIGTRINLILNKSSIKIPSALRDILYHIYNSAKERKNISSLVVSDILRTASLLVSGVPCNTPIFNGANEEDIQHTSEVAFPLKTAYKLEPTQTKRQLYLFDGTTGNRFSCPVTVGTMYYFKLHHLVEDKMHARSTGTYSIITQQPLGGKAQFGGQRIGEMEVWALEAYGAAYTLHEMLTIKSDDIWGRIKMYENIIKDSFILRTSVPESFNVLLREIRSLGVLLEVGD